MIVFLPADISRMVDLHEKPLPCYATHSYGCPCLFDIKLSQRISKAKARSILNSYLHGLRYLVNSGRYEDRDDFTVVLMPTLVNGNLPMHRPRPGARRQVRCGKRTLVTDVARVNVLHFLFQGEHFLPRPRLLPPGPEVPRQRHVT